MDPSVLLAGEDFEAFFLLCDGQHTPSDLPQLRIGNQGRVLGASSRAPRREVKTLWCSHGVRLLVCDSHAQKISLSKSYLLCCSHGLFISSSSELKKGFSLLC